jgi:hypothetical protein
MVYLATAGDQPLRDDVDLVVQEVEPSREAVRQWFSLPTIRFIGAYTGCSCGFPSVIAEEPIEYYDGMLDDHPDRQQQPRSVESLLALIRAHLHADGEVQLYPVSDGSEGAPPKGAIGVSVESLRTETFFLNEQFFYRVTRE